MVRATIILTTMVSIVSVQVKGECVTNCTGLPNGNYQACDSCTWFVICEPSGLHIEYCDSPLIYDDNAKVCGWTSSTCNETTISHSSTTATAVEETTTAHDITTAIGIEETTTVHDSTSAIGIEETTVHDSTSAIRIEETTVHDSTSAITVEETTNVHDSTTATSVEEITTVHASTPAIAIEETTTVHDSTTAFAVEDTTNVHGSTAAIAIEETTTVLASTTGTAVGETSAVPKEGTTSFAELDITSFSVSQTKFATDIISSDGIETAELPTTETVTDSYPFMSSDFLTTVFMNTTASLSSMAATITTTTAPPSTAPAAATTKTTLASCYTRVILRAGSCISNAPPYKTATVRSDTECGYLCDLDLECWYFFVKAGNCHQYQLLFPPCDAQLYKYTK